MRKDRSITSVSFGKPGIFIRYGDGEEQRIGDPIRVLALGQGLQDKLAYTVLELVKFCSNNARALENDLNWGR